MTGLKVKITRFTSDSFPGFVECQFADVKGKQWSIIDKVPVVTLAHLDADSVYPQPAILACTIIERRPQPDGQKILLIDTELPVHFEATSGETRFEVFANQVVEYEVIGFEKNVDGQTKRCWIERHEGGGVGVVGDDFPWAFDSTEGAFERALQFVANEGFVRSPR